MVPITIENVNSDPSPSSTKDRSIVSNPENTRHPLLRNKTLKLAAWLVSGNVWKHNEFPQGLQTLSPLAKKKEQEIITTQSSRNLVAGVVQNKLIPFNAV